MFNTRYAIIFIGELQSLIFSYLESLYQDHQLQLEQ
jgi:hypothetical protein